MVICKYFLHGSCRFGNNCKNEHSYNTYNTSGTENSQSVLRKKPEVDKNVIVKAVHDDVENADKSGQWPLSCYGPFQGKPCIPGIEDKSFEEVRLEMYEAQTNGTLEKYKQELAVLIQQNKIRMKTLQHPSPDTIQFLQDLYNVDPEHSQTNVFGSSSAFGSQTNQSPLANSIFSNQSSIPQIKPSIFGGAQVPQVNANNFTFALPENNTFNNFNQNSGSIFNNSNNQPNVGTNSSIFANVQNPPPAFGQQNFGSNIFAGTAPNANVFANSQTANFSNQIPANNTPQYSIFGNSQGTTFSNSQSSIFAPSQPATATTQPSIFATSPTNSFGSIFTQTPSLPSQQFAPQTSTNIFQTNLPVQTNEINSSVFGGAQNSVFNSANMNAVPVVPQNTNIFGGKQTTGGHFNKSVMKNDPSTYSKLEDLNNNDIKHFEAPTFEFGSIPEMAPTLELC